MQLPWFCLFSFLLTLVNGDYLQFVNLVYRHGDRSPMNSYPNSSYKEDFWQQGFGQLSTSGMRDQYRLGQYLRAKYNGFLSENYSRFQIKVVSTDEDRTLMSAECTLAGLYPPNAQQTWNKSMPWQPIPVHTGSAYAYYLPNITVCPYYHVLYKRMLKTPCLKEWNAEQAGFLKNISENAGYGHVLNISDVWHLTDPIRVERLHHLAQPRWITDEVFRKLVMISDAFLTYIYKHHGLNKLIGGSLLQKMVSSMDQKITSTIPLGKQRAVDMYSLHDTTIAAFLSALGVYNGIAPPYSACVGLELWNNNETYYVKLWYKNETNTKPHVIKIPGCNATSCPFTEFKRLMKDVLPGDMELACRIPFYMNKYVIVTFVTGAVFLMLLVLSIIFCRSEIKQRNKRYLIDRHGETLCQYMNVSIASDESEDEK